MRNNLLSLAASFLTILPSTESRSLILGGEDANPSRFPYFVSLLDSNGVFFCGGTLVASDVVLTAAHCWKASMSSVAIGGDQQEVIAIKTSTFHPGFTNEILSHDIMLIKLETPSSKTPVRLNFNSSVPAQEDAEITVIGMGLIDDENGFPVAADTLQQVSLGYFPNQKCSRFGEKYHDRIQDDMICADGTHDKNAFKGWYDGDSGGPLLILGATPEEDIQVGVVSFSANGYPGVASRTSANEDIIRSVICQPQTESPTYLGCRLSSSQTKETDIPLYHLLDEPVGMNNCSGPVVEETAGMNHDIIKMVVYAVPGVLALGCSIVLFACICCKRSKKDATVQKTECLEESETEEETNAGDRTEILDTISALAKDIKNTECDSKRVAVQIALKAEISVLRNMNRRIEPEPVVVQRLPASQNLSFDDALDMALDIIGDTI
ncbi:peptidase S1 and S6 chymotrypsin/Hap family protein [Nitzschia inconspicua]|uniref:Peptidase S1 and S6 chymotrypsin/Hap family protein n=1 Tax=Nitzschia inconspicua TaxID=303405 RepID=A0A9K3KIM3_9STRA|nr:peptidase S1 and S6 chymotrypsin/Hap family protein [Nitzschia inconspicua]